MQAREHVVEARADRELGGGGRPLAHADPQPLEMIVECVDHPDEVAVDGRNGLAGPRVDQPGLFVGPRGQRGQRIVEPDLHRLSDGVAERLDDRLQPLVQQPGDRLVVRLGRPDELATERLGVRTDEVREPEHPSLERPVHVLEPLARLDPHPVAEERHGLVQRAHRDPGPVVQELELLGELGDLLVGRPDVRLRLVVCRHRLHAGVRAPGKMAHGLDPLLDVLLHRLRDPCRLLDDELTVLADPQVERVDDLLVTSGERLERGRHLPADLVQLRADLTDAERRGAATTPGLEEGVGAAGDLFSGRTDRLGEHVHRVLDPAGPGREGLEPFVRVRDQRPDRLVAGELPQDRGADRLLVASCAPPYLPGDLVHQRVRGVLDRPQALVELLLDHLLVGPDHQLGPLGGRRRQSLRLGW